MTRNYYTLAELLAQRRTARLGETRVTEIVAAIDADISRLLAVDPTARADFERFSNNTDDH